MAREKLRQRGAVITDVLRGGVGGTIGQRGRVLNNLREMIFTATETL